MHNLILTLAKDISTHASLAGRDRREGLAATPARYFNPRVPCGTRPESPRRSAPCGNISTHASLAGRDVLHHALRCRRGCISTHASLAGRDKPRAGYAAGHEKFQPTRPLRDATFFNTIASTCLQYFNPRVPCGTRPPRWFCSA